MNKEQFEKVREAAKGHGPVYGPAPGCYDSCCLTLRSHELPETRRLLREAYKALRAYKSPPDLMEEIGKFLERDAT
jgi:hypothetical protein